MLSADLKARCLVWGFVTWCGEYGCHNCLLPGQKRNGIKKGNARNWIGNAPPKDDNFFTKAKANLSIGDSVAPYFGVKRWSILHKILNPAYSNPSDSLHTIWIGVVSKTLQCILTDKRLPIKALKAHMDDAVRSSTWPNSFLRTVKSVQDIKTWKGTEYKNFFIYCLIPSAYHVLSVGNSFHQRVWNFLVDFHTYIYTIHLQELPKESVPQLKNMGLHLFNEYRQLFGDDACTMKSHVLFNHLIDEICIHGLPWGYSTFVFEGFYYLHQRLATKHNGAVDQIARRFCQQRESELFRHTKMDETSKIGDFVRRNMPVKSKIKPHTTVQAGSLFGEPTPVPEIYKSYLCGRNWSSFQKMKYKNVLYCTKLSQEKVKLANYYVKFDAPAYPDHTAYGILLCIAQKRNAIKCIIQILKIIRPVVTTTTTTHIDIVEKTNNIICLDHIYLTNLCICNVIKHTNFITMCNNLYEHN